MEFRDKGERVQAQLPHQQIQVEVYNQGAGWGSVDGQLLRGDIKAKGILASPTQWLKAG